MMEDAAHIVPDLDGTTKYDKFEIYFVSFFACLEHLLRCSQYAIVIPCSLGCHHVHQVQYRIIDCEVLEGKQ